MSATEELRALLDERGADWRIEFDGATELESAAGDYSSAVDVGDDKLVFTGCLTPEQAIVATLGARKARAHPYGWEPDTGAFDVTRCECGCLNDISATYCNDCGGEIEIDVNHEKELWEYSPWHVPAIKHDDGSLEFDGRRYIATTLGGGRLTAEQVRDFLNRHSMFDCDTRWNHGTQELVFDEDELPAMADELNAALGDDGYKQAAAYWKRMYEELLTERIGEEHDYPEHDGRYECPDCGNVVYYDELYGGGWTIYVEDYQIPFNHCPKCGKAVKR